MPAPDLMRQGRTLIVAASVLLVAAGPQPQRFKISQKDQSFQPGEVSIKQGDVVAIANDDDDVLHHAYVESSKFKFDSGDQEPGTTVDIAFPVSGTFTVLCGIHPRMKLRVKVE